MSVLKLKNTYGHKVETFQPLGPAGKKVTMYTCGPTVYSFAHIGNFRSFLFADVLRRVLERNEYEVRHVMNITDVGHLTQDDIADAQGEDKMLKAAAELGWDPEKVARHFEDAFVEDAKSLRLKNYTGDEADIAALHPRAASHVPEMLAAIQKLIENDFAYVDSNGQVYFDIQKFPEYGELSGKVLEDLDVGARVAVSADKKDPRDFYLWKVDGKHLMQWDPHSESGWTEEDLKRYRMLLPDGVDERIRPGFPGWHIECSAMSRAHLGNVIDIHTGGEDNIFPHHECEVAQSYGAYKTQVDAPHGADDEGSKRKSFARYWVHGRHLLVNNKKMSKSAGTFFTVRDLLSPERDDLKADLDSRGFKEGVPANVLRYALLSNQYTQPMNFSLDLLAQSKASVERIQTRVDKLKELVGNTGSVSDDVRKIVDEGLENFDAALNDNLNTPNALAAVFNAVGELNQIELSPAEATEALRLLESFDEVLDVLATEARSGLLTREEVQALIDAGELPDADSLLSGELASASLASLVAIRQKARKEKDFALADKIRDKAKAKGVQIEDTPEGFRWVRL
ncbi:MAG: cysteine--tRNA ligase [Planctomycetota bacterium]|jgi:cysteinyl-tRNA synthetase